MPAAAGNFDPRVADVVVRESGKIFLLAVQMAAPLIAINFLVNFSLAILSRAAPMINAFLLSIPIQIIAGLTVLGMVHRADGTLRAKCARWSSGAHASVHPLAHVRPGKQNRTTHGEAPGGGALARANRARAGTASGRGAARDFCRHPFRGQEHGGARGARSGRGCLATCTS